MVSLISSVSIGFCSSQYATSLLIHLEGGGFRRGDQEKPRLAERLFDHRPPMRRGGQAGVVAKQAEYPAPIPGLAAFLDP